VHSDHLGYDTLSLGKWFLMTFWRNVSSPSRPNRSQNSWDIMTLWHTASY